MDAPDTSTRKGPAPARDRSSRARLAGSVFDIGGIPLLLRGTDEGLQDLLDTLFDSLPVSAETPVGEIVCGRQPIAVPDRPPDESYSDLSAWHDGDVLVLVSDRHGFRARATPGGAEISASGYPHVLGLRRLLHPVFTHVLAWHETYVLHGAAVRRADVAFLVLGESGQGKSTLALAALEHDWRVLADDLVAVRLNGDGLSMQGIPKPLAVPGDLSADVVDGAQALDGDWRDRRHLSADHLDPRPTPMSAVLVVAHGEDRAAEATPLESSGVTSLLFTSFMSTPDPVLVRGFFRVGAAVARRPIWRVVHSADPSLRLAEMARVLDTLAAAAEDQ